MGPHSDSRIGQLQSCVSLIPSTPLPVAGHKSDRILLGLSIIQSRNDDALSVSITLPTPCHVVPTSHREAEEGSPKCPERAAGQRPLGPSEYQNSPPHSEK